MSGLGDEARGLHREALDYNWDDGLAAPRRLLADPGCDRGTAFLLLWRSYSPLERILRDDDGRDDDSRDEPPWLRQVKEFASEVEARLATGDFASEAIRVDLHDDLQLSRVQIEKLRRAGLGEHLLGPTPGVPFV